MNNAKYDKRRKVAYIDGNFHLLKPKETNDKGKIEEWHPYGKQKSIKGIYDIMQSNIYEIVEIDATANRYLEEYIRKKRKSLTEKL